MEEEQEFTSLLLMESRSNSSLQPCNLVIFCVNLRAGGIFSFCCLGNSGDNLKGIVLEGVES